jgi:hypothetical protein
MADRRATNVERTESERPDPEERTAAERRKVEHVSGFQGDKREMPLKGEKALDTDGTATPPISSLPPEEANRQVPKEPEE